MSDAQPIIWKCQCGWVGKAEDMVPETYTCPDCGQFDMEIVLFIRKPNPVIAWSIES